MAPSELHVRKLTLFSHGLSQLELVSEVTDDETLYHVFPEKHMNDILKSLTVVDSEGKISSISYSAPRADPPIIEPMLNVDSHEALKTLLENAQGASVVVYVGDKVIAATLLGLQWPLIERDDEKREDRVKLVLMEQSWRVITVDIEKVCGIQFEDPQYQKRLDRLKESNTKKHGNTKSVTIITKGTTKRSVVVNYAVESPVPKFTYRFLLKQSDNETETVFIQCWAIVDNPTNQDFEDIDMAIVSGMPMSFRHDLYDTRFVKRPTERVVQKKAHGTPSQATFGGMPKMAKRSGISAFGASASVGSVFGAGSDAGRIGGAGIPPPMFQSAPGMPPFEQAVEEEESGFDDEGGWQDSLIGGQERATEAASSEVGNMYEYSIPVKVTIKARESALVPLIMRAVKGSRVDIYSRKVRSGNTLSAVRVRNITDAAFESGPVCVYEKSRLVGEGMMKSCRPGGELFVPYSINLDCSVEMKEEFVDGGIVKVSVVDGMFEMVRERLRVVKYRFDYRGNETVVFVLHEMSPGFEKPSALQGMGSGSGDDDQKDVELRKIVDGTARFRMKIADSETETLTVTERQSKSTRHNIRSCCTEAMITELTKKNAISESIGKMMEAVLEKENNLSSIRAELFKLNSEIKRLKEAQERIRSNYKALGALRESHDDETIKKIVDILADSEKEIREIEKKIEETEEKSREIEKEVDDIVALIVKNED